MREEERPKASGRAHVIWPLALAAITCVYNLPQVLAGSVQYDALEVHYASQQYLSAELHAGRLPFWTPYIFSGFPFLADLQVAAWYPLNWPFFAAGISPRSIDLELLLHDVIATLGAYALGKHMLGKDKAGAAALAGVFYGLSGWFASHSQHVGMFDTAAWLPWLMLTLLRVRLDLALTALLGAAIMLPGSFQLALYTFAFTGVWAACEAAWQRSWRTAQCFAIRLGAAALGGAFLSAVMILPAAELAARSVRTQLNALNLPDIGYFHVGSLVTLVNPNYFGLLSGQYTGPGDSTQHYFYAGILLLPLAAIGIRNATTLRMAIFLGLPFLAYALGPAGGLYDLVARLPGFSSVELPMHGWFLPTLGLALLGGAGAARIPQRWIPVVAIVVVIDVLTVNQLLNPLAYARTDTFGVALDQFAHELATATPRVERVYGPPLAEVGYRNHGLQSRVETTYGYNPLELAAYARYADATEADASLRKGFAATHDLGPDGELVRDLNALPLAYFPDGSGTAIVSNRSENGLTVHYAAASPTMMRVAIPSYPGWTATLDSHELPMSAVDQAFISVEVPGGGGDITLAYTPTFFAPGAVISAATSVVVLVTLLVQRATERLETRDHVVDSFLSLVNCH